MESAIKIEDYKADSIHGKRVFSMDAIKAVIEGEITTAEIIDWDKAAPHVLRSWIECLG